MSIEEVNKSIIAKLNSLGRKEEEYDIEDGFAIYKGSPVDYKKIKILFKIRVSEVFIEEKTSSAVETTKAPEIFTKPIEVSETTEATTDLPKEKEKKKEEFEEEEDNKDKDIVYLKSFKIREGAEEIAEKIGIFLNINGTSKTRKNVIFLKKLSYTMDEITKKLFLRDRTVFDKEKADRKELTIERIASSYAEETARYLKKHKKYIKIKDLNHLGFTKSYFCNEVRKSQDLAEQVYKSYLKYAATWKSGNPLRFAEKNESILFFLL